MKRINVKKIILSLTLFGFIAVSNAQISNIGAVLSGGVEDAKMLLTEYMRPYANGLGANLNGGWYNSAKPHKLGGFDVTFSISAAIVPTADRSFDASTLVFSPTDPNITVSGSGASSPTVAGDKVTGQTITYTYDDNEPLNILTPADIASYNLPKGTGVPYFPSPMIQAGIGLIKGTEIIGRFMPQTKLGLKGGTKAGMWGIGIKHSISQWIPALKKVPVFNMSFMGGYTKLTLNSGINVDPEMIGSVADPGLTASFDDQSLDMVVSGYTLNLIVSADLPVICIYGGAGISNSKATIALLGYYPMPDVTDPEFNVTNESVLEDPINLEFENKDGSATKPRLNIGARLKFAVITLHADYTYANYSVITAGLGINFR